ncbi:MAG: hypothetical protein A3A44_03370 [Candidatus Sungbacteria bacterium RIFCSPLOWO2_01_FULL_60_25]|uniref:acylphosphatase n=1 Tax=Candidatus Sungbacteria bacterium RIFCSPLOWO2_01_FULL_60_25 TaxID=1802281 RepID=A0A1G2LDD8_9BACT|nr:MAG: hypothetical protein A3A44_03370 [Candidatus Sungbacteria bacterium RIFCSPLOWO2_01_FULL_60_25]
MQRCELSIFGRVQGVLFRQTARRHAEKLGLVGRARNEDDGSLSLVVEGEPGALHEFANWCRTGPPLARVDDVAVEEKGATGEFRDFRVL